MVVVAAEVVVVEAEEQEETLYLLTLGLFHQTGPNDCFGLPLSPPPPLITALTV